MTWRMYMWLRTQTDVGGEGTAHAHANCTRCHCRGCVGGIALAHLFFLQHMGGGAQQGCASPPPTTPPYPSPPKRYASPPHMSSAPRPLQKPPNPPYIQMQQRPPAAQGLPKQHTPLLESLGRVMMMSEIVPPLSHPCSLAYLNSCSPEQSLNKKEWDHLLRSQCTAPSH